MKKNYECLSCKKLIIVEGLVVEQLPECPVLCQQCDPAFANQPDNKYWDLHLLIDAAKRLMKEDITKHLGPIKQAQELISDVYYATQQGD